MITDIETLKAQIETLKAQLEESEEKAYDEHMRYVAEEYETRRLEQELSAAHGLYMDASMEADALQGSLLALEDRYADLSALTYRLVRPLFDSERAARDAIDTAKGGRGRTF